MKASRRTRLVLALEQTRAWVHASWTRGEQALSDSAWAPVLLKALLLGIGLLTLAWIGRVAIAATHGPTRLADASDGGLPSAHPIAIEPPTTLAPATAAIPTPSAVATLASPASSPQEPSHRVSDRASADHPVYLNDASVDELRRLPGVGEKRAEAIVALRRRLGRFQRVEDLLKVKGIGRTTLRRWRPLLRLDSRPLLDAGALR